MYCFVIFRNVSLARYFNNAFIIIVFTLLEPLLYVCMCVENYRINSKIKETVRNPSMISCRRTYYEYKRQNIDAKHQRGGKTHLKTISERKINCVSQ